MAQVVGFPGQSGWYQEQEKWWRQRYRRIRRRQLGMGAVYVLMVILWFVAPWTHTWILAWFGAIVLFFALMAAWNGQALYADQRRRQVKQGLEAEEIVAKRLNQLPDSFVVIHDVSIGRENIDHILVGQHCLFLIETKSHQGQITVAPHGKRALDWIFVNLRPVEKDFFGQLIRQTWFLKETLTPVFEHASQHFVEGALCFTRAEIPISVSRVDYTPYRFSVLPDANLLPWILTTDKLKQNAAFTAIRSNIVNTLIQG